MNEVSKFGEFEELSLSEKSIKFLKETAKWSFFLSIIGFIGIGFILLIGIVFALVARGLSDQINPYAELGVSQSFLTIIYLFSAVIGFFPVYYLFKFSQKMKIAIKKNNVEELTAAFSNLKSYFKFLGILTIVMITIYLLLFIGVGIFSGTARANGF